MWIASYARQRLQLSAMELRQTTPPDMQPNAAEDLVREWRHRNKCELPTHPMQSCDRPGVYRPCADRSNFLEMLVARATKDGTDLNKSNIAGISGKFACILRFEVHETNQSESDGPLRNFNRPSFIVSMERQPASFTKLKNPSMVLALLGDDQQGIVSEVSAALARHDARIDRMESSRESVPFCDQAVLLARIEVRVSTLAVSARLRREFEALANVIDVEINVEDDT